jgi:predicted  nucleic acid-binding Zn-ribbon protein
MSTSSSKLAILVGSVVLAGAAWAGLRAQGLGQANDNSMAALTNEVRQLRLVVQEAGRSQTQMQALSISLTAQHSRLTQVNDRLDTVNGELLGVSAKAEEARRMMGEAQAELSRARDATERAHATDMLELFKRQATQLGDQETQLRQRQSELTNQFRMEEQRWIELAQRLEEIIKR